jgi:adenylate kinase family enzyme
MKTFLAITGQAGSGKTTLSNMLEAEHGFTRMSGSEILRAENDTLPADIRMDLGKRADVTTFQRVWKMIHGRDALGKRAAAAFNAMPDDGRLCYEGVRNIYDAKTMKRAGAIVTSLECDFEERYRRIVLRDPSRAITREQAMEDDALEHESQDALGLHLRQVRELADIRIDSNEPVERVMRQLIDALRSRGIELDR